VEVDGSGKITNASSIHGFAEAWVEPEAGHASSGAHYLAGWVGWMRSGSRLGRDRLVGWAVLAGKVFLLRRRNASCGGGGRCGYGEKDSSRESLSAYKVKTHGNVYRERGASYMWQQHKMQHYRRQKRLCFPPLLHTSPPIDLSASHRYVPRPTFFTEAILTQPPTTSSASHLPPPPLSHRTHLAPLPTEIESTEAHAQALLVP